MIGYFKLTQILTQPTPLSRSNFLDFISIAKSKSPYPKSCQKYPPYSNMPSLLNNHKVTIQGGFIKKSRGFDLPLDNDRGIITHSDLMICHLYFNKDFKDTNCFGKYQ